MLPADGAGLGFLKDTIFRPAGQIPCAGPVREIGLREDPAGLAFLKHTVLRGRPPTRRNRTPRLLSISFLYPYRTIPPMKNQHETQAAAIYDRAKEIGRAHV